MILGGSPGLATRKLPVLLPAQPGTMETKLRKRTLQDKPAIVIAAFGSSRSGRVVYDALDQELREAFPDYELVWAYTSEIVREKTGHPGILQALALLEEKGYRKVVVQPVHVFPGTEYRVLEEQSRGFPGIRVVMGETLMHRWPFVEQAVEIVSEDFIDAQEGVNLLIAHGTPLCADPVNAVYLGLDSVLRQEYENVMLGVVEGVPSLASVLAIIERMMKGKDTPAESRPKAMLIPLMYVAGVHVEDDLLGEGDTCRTALADLGFDVVWPTVAHNGVTMPKGLGWYAGIRACFVERVRRALGLMEVY